MLNPEVDSVRDLAAYRQQHPDKVMPSFDVDDENRKPGDVFSIQEFVKRKLPPQAQQFELEKDIRTSLLHEADVINLIRQDYENLMHNPRDLALHHGTLMNALNTYMKRAQDSEDYKIILRKLECAGKYLSRFAQYIEVTGRGESLTHEHHKFLSDVGAVIPTPEEIRNLKCKLRAEALCRLIVNKNKD